MAVGENLTLEKLEHWADEDLLWMNQFIHSDEIEAILKDRIKGWLRGERKFLGADPPKPKASTPTR